MRLLLTVELTGSSLEASWVSQGSGGARAVLQARRTIDEGVVRTLSVDLARVLNRGSRWADGDQGSRALLRRKGEALFDTLLPAPIKAALRGAADEVGATLFVDATHLDFVPWELLHTGFGFIGLLFAVGRGDDAPSSQTAAQRMLIVADPRGDLIGSYYEGLTLRDDVGARDDITVDLRSSEVGIADVRELIRDYDVVHYAGHAEPTGPGQERGWWLRDGVLGAAAVRELGGGRAFPRLVFVNACRSARVEPEQHALPSLAEAFREAGAEQVIGTVWDVPDEPASGFALAFYAHLMAGVPIGEAVRRARVALAERYGEDSVFWAAWVLHGGPDGRFFASTAAPSSVQSVRARALPEPAARVRGAAVALEGIVTTGVDRRWLRWAGAVAALSACVALAFSVGRATVETARPARAITDDTIERVAPAGIAPLGVGGVSWGDELASLELAAVIARADGKLVEVSALASGESFRLRFVVPRSGFVSLWHVDGDGRVQRVYPRDSIMSSASGAREVVWPNDRWLALDAGRGTERFLLAWRERAPADIADFGAELDQEITNVGSDDVAERTREVLEDRFDRVRAIEVEHR